MGSEESNLKNVFWWGGCGCVCVRVCVYIFIFPRSVSIRKSWASINSPFIFISSFYHIKYSLNNKNATGNNKLHGRWKLSAQTKQKKGERERDEKKNPTYVGAGRKKEKKRETISTKADVGSNITRSNIEKYGFVSI